MKTLNEQSRRSVLVLSLLAIALWIGLTLAERPTAAQPTEDVAAALAVVGEFNAWRLELGLWPLKYNATLHDLALEQASYLGTLSDIPSGTAMHLGPNGERPRERALYPQFNWPSYGGVEQVDIAEVGAVGTLESAISFWKGSDIHRETITNPVFREIGVAALPHPWGHIYIAVLGGRPDVLPALVDPRSNVLYLTQDVWKYGPGNVPPMRVLLFDAEGKPLNNAAWLEWSLTIPVPEGAGGTVFVLYSDGSRESLTEVNLAHNQVILPGYVPAVESAPVITQQP